MKNLYATVITILLFSTFSFGQDTSSVSHISDNLGNTESSRAIYKGKLLTTISTGYHELKVDNIMYASEYKTVTAPVISAGYGLFKFMDIRLKVGLNYEEQLFSRDQIKAYRFPLYSKELKTKINLVKQKKWVPEISYSFTLTGYLESFAFNTLAFSYQWKEKFRLGGNFGLAYNNSDFPGPIRMKYYSLNTRYQFSPGFGFFADVRLEERFSVMKNLNTQIGLYYQLNNNMQFHLNGGRIFRDSYNNINEFYASGGFSWMLFGSK